MYLFICLFIAIDLFTALNAVSVFPNRLIKHSTRWLSVIGAPLLCLSREDNINTKEGCCCFQPLFNSHTAGIIAPSDGPRVHSEKRQAEKMQRKKNYSLGNFQLKKKTKEAQSDIAVGLVRRWIWGMRPFLTAAAGFGRRQFVKGQPWQRSRTSAASPFPSFRRHRLLLRCVEGCFGVDVELCDLNSWQGLETG